MNKEVKKVFQPGPMVSIRSPKNLSSYLVRAKIYPMERKTGPCKCKGNMCQVCLNVSETETFTSIQKSCQTRALLATYLQNVGTSWS